VQTNRLTVLNQDLSSYVNPNPAGIIGGTVINAPKGTAKWQYVPPLSTNTILSLFGQPSSTWPDIQELIDFNSAGYGVYVSAPGGSYTGTGVGTSTYNLQTYFGGVYATTIGTWEPFYQVQEDLSTGNPSFNNQIVVIPSTTGTGFATGTTTPSASGGTGSASVVINGFVNPAYASSVSYIGISYIRSSTWLTGVPSGYANTVTTLIFQNSGGTLKLINPATGLEVPSVVAGSINLTSGQVTIPNSSYTTYTDPVTGQAFTDLNFSAAPTFISTPIFGSSLSAGAFYVQTLTQSQIISAIYQSSPRANAGSFTVANVDTRATIYPTYQVTWSLSSATLSGGGNLTVCGNTLAIPSTVVTATGSSATTSLAGYLASSAVVIPGYAITTNGGGTNIIITQTVATLPPSSGLSSSSSLATLPSIVIPTTGGVTGLTSVVLGSGVVVGLTTAGPAFTNPTNNTFSFSYAESISGGGQYTLGTTLSTNPLATDSRGNNIFSDDYLAGNSYIESITWQDIGQVANSVTWSTPTVTFQGQRANLSSQFVASTMGSIIRQAGWNNAYDPAIVGVNIFFDASSDANVAGIMATLRTSSLFPNSTFITSINPTVGAPATPSGMTAVMNNIASLRNLLPNITGLAYYVGPMYIRENYSGTSYWNFPIGSTAAMLALDMQNYNGGLAPMWINDTSGIGGQISNGKVKRQKYKFTANNLDQLDQMGVNPLVLDNQLGLILTSQRTAQSPLNLTDYSYLGHQMSFDLFIAQIRQNVMLPQIGKFIDNFHMQSAKDKCNFYLNSRLSGPQSIWSAGVVLVQEVNTPQTLSANQFKIVIRVKVYPYSEFVTLNFTNVGQTSTVTI